MSFPTPVLTLTVPEGQAGRVDVWLASRVEDLSRREAARLASMGQVRVNGRRIEKGTSVRGGDQIDILAQWKTPRWSVLPCAEMALDILYEDASMIAVNKPAGVPSCALSPEDDTALACGIAARFPECAAVGRNGDAGLVHRLDAETSGILIAARSTAACDALRRQQEADGIEKRYLALVNGPYDGPRTLAFPLKESGPGARKVTVHPQGRPALTVVEQVRELTGGQSLLTVLIHRGVRHQIRAHLAHAGYPIAGDPLYGNPPLPGPGRLFLHACAIRLNHPVHRRTVALECPLPDELQRALLNG